MSLITEKIQTYTKYGEFETFDYVIAFISTYKNVAGRIENISIVRLYANV